MNLDAAFLQLQAASRPVPKLLRLPTVDELEQAERELGFPFPPDYRRFQLEVSNLVAGVLEPAVIVPGVHPYRDLRHLAPQAWMRGVPAGVLPFCYDNGNYHYMDALGQTGLWDHDDQCETRGGQLADWINEIWLAD